MARQTTLSPETLIELDRERDEREREHGAEAHVMHALLTLPRESDEPGSALTRPELTLRCGSCESESEIQPADALFIAWVERRVLDELTELRLVAGVELIAISCGDPDHRDTAWDEVTGRADSLAAGDPHSPLTYAPRMRAWDAT